MYDENAPKLIENGYHSHPIAPVGFEPPKVPVRYEPSLNRHVMYKGWTEAATPLTSPQPGAGIGLRCGNGLVALDFDDDKAALEISEKIPSAVNKTGRRAFTSLHYADFDVPSEDIYDSDGKLVAQILSTGRQTVIPPSIHPETKLPYHWTNGASCYDTRLTELSPLPRDYRERIMALGYTFGGRKAKPEISVDEGENGFNDNPCGELNAVALKNLAAWVPALNLYKCQPQRGRYRSYRAVATWRESMTGRKLEERDLNLSICSSGIKDFGDKRTYSPLDLVMAARGTSLEEAFCWLEEKLLPQKPDIEVDWEKIAETQDAPNTAPDDDDGNDDDGAKEIAPKRRRINPIPLILPAERNIPRRLFLYRQHYLRGTVSATIGTGGTGKSTLGLTEGVGMEIGRDLLGNEKIERPYRVWYHNAEETLDELIRRSFAICKHFNIDQKQLEHFYITNGFETPIKVAGGGRDVKIDTALRKEIIEVIGDLKIDVVIFDPLVAMHRVHEDFNSALDPVIRDAFGKIAHDTNSSIDLCHHTRKKPAGQDGEYTAADSRGGQSFVDAVRGLRVLNTMSKAEAANFDLREDDRFDYMKLSRGKANMVRRGVIGWYRFVPVELNNGVPEDGIAGDTVAIIDRWEPPKDSDLVRTPTHEDRVFLVGALQYGEYRYDTRSPNWFGFKIAERLGADKKDPKQMKVVAAILDDLIEDGTLQVKEKKDEHHKMRQFIVPGILAGVENL